MSRFLRSQVSIAAVLFTLFSPCAPTALAVPADQDTVTVYGWRQLGMASSVNFAASNSPQTVVIPVPQGLSPDTLRGVMHSASNIGVGYLEALTPDGRSLGTTPVPDVAAQRVSMPFAVPLTGVKVRGKSAEVQLVLRSTRGDEICGPLPNLTISDLSVDFTGQPVAPTTVQSFFPPVAPRIDVYVNPEPGVVEQQAVLSLVSALTVHYHPAPVDVSVHRLDRDGATPPPAAPGLSRSVLIRQSDQAGVSVTTGDGGSICPSPAAAAHSPNRLRCCGRI